MPYYLVLGGKSRSNAGYMSTCSTRYISAITHAQNSAGEKARCSPCTLRCLQVLSALVASQTEISWGRLCRGRPGTTCRPRKSLAAIVSKRLIIKQTSMPASARPLISRPPVAPSRHSGTMIARAPPQQTVVQRAIPGSCMGSRIGSGQIYCSASFASPPEPPAGAPTTKRLH